MARCRQYLGGNRIPAVKLAIQQQSEISQRGAIRREAVPFPACRNGGRLRTKFELQTYLTSWQKSSAGPSYGPLFQSALGGDPVSCGRSGGFGDRRRESSGSAHRTA